MEFRDIQHEIIEEIVALSAPAALPFSEYSFIQPDSIKKSFKNVLSSAILKDDTIGKAVYNKDQLKGYFLLEKAEFDSEIFGFNAYRLSFMDIFEPDVSVYQKIIQEIISEIEHIETLYEIKYLVYSVNANRSDSALQLSCLNKHSFYLINTLLSFSTTRHDLLRETQNKIETDSEIHIRRACLNDVEQIVEIARNSHRLNRFYLDPNLDKKKCDLLHATSARNAIVQGFADMVFVAEYKGKIVGYYSGKKKINHDLNLILGEALISAVLSEYRGRGIFNLLDDHLLRWFIQETDVSEMGTYINNPAVYKTWMKKGLHLIRGTYQIAKFNQSVN